VLAAATAIAAASFAIEQVGMPKLGIVGGRKRGNELVNVEERMEKYQKRIEDMGDSLDV